LNWFGEKYHETDTYIHWQEKNPNKVSKEYRELYDKIVESGNEDELKKLLSIAYDSGRLDAEDENNPDL